MTEIKVGHKYVLFSENWKQGHEAEVTSVTEGTVYYKPGLWFDDGNWTEKTFLDNWKLVEDVKMFNAGDKVRVSDNAETVSGGYVDSNFFGQVVTFEEIDRDRDYMVRASDDDFQYIAPEFLTLFEVEPLQQEIKKGDYLTEKGGEIVWKVSKVYPTGYIDTTALFIGKTYDTADEVHLTSGVVDTLIKASPEQIAAFNNHPYWGEKEDEEPVVEDAISPSVYQFPNGVEVRDISAHLTSFGGQAVQYIARATRLDGVVKGKPVEDLRKAIELLQWEAERLEALES